MGIALLALTDLFTPLQSLASRWMPARRGRSDHPTGLRYVAIRPTLTRRRDDNPASVDAVRRALRVVQVVDSASPRGTTGRMVISGRMADVCAELDRLAAQEALERGNGGNTAAAAAKALH